jgi:hypothetical protein
LFKVVELSSVSPEAIVKTLTSSGTSSQQPSKIYLDKETALLQTRALTSIVRAYLGPKRLPMVIADHPGVVKSRDALSARGAGILGFSQFGYDHTYLFDEAMQLDRGAAEQFLARHSGETVLLFGFTFIVWKHLYQASAGERLDLSKCILIHGGGWKKLADQQVAGDEFKRRLTERFGIRRIHNYYGMVEQTGSIFMECEAGFFHASQYSDVLVRDPGSLEVLPCGKAGLLQLMSNIPRSYPGHVILSEDLGVLIGEDDCACGRKGKYFLVEGRLPEAELRGCSDTYREGS